MIKGTSKFAKGVGDFPRPFFPDPTLRNRDGEEVPMVKIKTFLKQPATAGCQDNIQKERWPGKFLKSRL